MLKGFQGMPGHPGPIGERGPSGTVGPTVRQEGQLVSISHDFFWICCEHSVHSTQAAYLKYIVIY